MRTNPYVQAAIAFAESALDPNQKAHGRRIVQAAKRFLRDIETENDTWYFDPDYALHACAAIETMPHIEGTWAMPVIRLEPFQCFMLVQLFGFRQWQPIRGQTIRIGGVERPFCPRRFTAFLFACARKNAKSTIAAAIGLYVMLWEPEPGQQLYSAATSYKQAMPIFGAAKAMAERSSDLRYNVGLTAYSKKLQHVSGNIFEPLHAKAKTKDGLNPQCVLIDEVHAHPNGDLINVLSSAAGARTAPLFAYFTTEGYLTSGPWTELRQFADAVLAGDVEADHYLPIIFAVDKDDGDFDEACWVKANPLMLTNGNLLKAIQKEAIEAKGMPSRLAEFRIKRLNRPSNPANAWLDLARWVESGDGLPVTVDDFKGLDVYGAYDGASTNDIAAFRILAEHPKRGLITMGWKWAPSGSVDSRTARGSVPYAGWVEAGWMVMTDGDVIDTRVIREKIIQLDKSLFFRKICLDPWNAKQLAGELLEAGLLVEEFIQGPRTYHPVMRKFEEVYFKGQLCHGGDPVLRWCASNLIVRYDVNLNMAPDKRRAPDKIDDAVALLMALGAWMSEHDEAEYRKQCLENPI